MMEGESAETMQAQMGKWMAWIDKLNKTNQSTGKSLPVLCDPWGIFESTEYITASGYFKKAHELVISHMEKNPWQ